MTQAAATGTRTGKTTKTVGQKQKLAKLLKQSQKLLAAGDTAEASKKIIAAWNMEPENFDLLVAVADVLARLGVRRKAIEVLEKALQIHGPKPDVLLVMGNLALELQMPEVLEKVYRIYINVRPEDPQGYNNLASALEQQDKLDETIEFLQNALPLFPEDAAMWNTLATAVSKRDGYEASIPFYAEAYRLDPKSFNILNNISLAFENTGQHEQAIEFGEKAIAVNPDGYYAHLGLATSLLAVGELKRGWDHYEWRQDSRRQGSVIYTHGLPRWDGGSLEGKTLLVGPEQGLGDEILFAMAYPALIEEGATLYIGCDKRLISLYERSFPGARVGAYKDGFEDAYRYRSMPNLQGKASDDFTPADLFIECGSIPQHKLSRIEDFQNVQTGFLKPDPERLAEIQSRLNTISDRPKVGIYWRSGLNNALRGKHYAPIEAWGDIFRTYGDRVDFINLQYGDCAAERDLVQEKFGITIHDWDDLDLRDDLEGVAALSAALDLAIGPASAPGMFTFGVGTPTWWLLPIRPWWSFGETDHPPFFPEGRLIIGQVDDPWPGIMAALSGHLETFLEDRG